MRILSTAASHARVGSTVTHWVSKHQPETVTPASSVNLDAALVDLSLASTWQVLHWGDCSQLTTQRTQLWKLLWEAMNVRWGMCVHSALHILSSVKQVPS